MNNINIFDYPNYLQIIFDKLYENSIKPIIIGGFVRDFLLKRDSKDIDVELYGVTSFTQLESILQEFGEVNNVGKSFGVCKLSLETLEIDFTLPRIDNKISSGHCGFEVKIDKDLDFKTATSRRDFTINAIGYDPIEKKLLDPFNGLSDLENKILRAVDINKFAQDPLRVLRAVGFSSRLDFKIDNELFILCKDMCNNNALEELPKERIYEEIKKILLKSTKPSVGFHLLKKLDALKYLSPIHKLKKEDFEEIVNAIDNIVKHKLNDNKTNILLMLAVICNKFNKKEIREFLSNLTNEKILEKKILSLVQNNFQDFYSDSELFLLATKVNIEHFLIFSAAINNLVDSEVFENIKIRAKELKILNEKASPFLQGRDILACGLKPSQQYSQILSSAYTAQINLEIKNHEEAKKWLNKYLST